jgi:hypothetical protein
MPSLAIRVAHFGMRDTVRDASGRGRSMGTNRLMRAAMRLVTGACGVSAIAACDAGALPSNAVPDGSVDAAPGLEGAPGADDDDTAPLDGPGAPAPESGSDARVDADSDPTNCGAVGHDCKGAPCIGGACSSSNVPLVLASGQSPTWMAVDSSNVYWMNARTAPAGASGASALVRCAVAGCNGVPGTVWSGSYAVDGLAVSGASLFWSTSPGPAGLDASAGSGPGIVGCAAAGCGAAATVLTSVAENISSFTADGANAYFTTTAGYVRQCALAGCPSGPTILAANLSSPTSVASNGTAVFWTTSSASAVGGQVMRCGVDGCAGIPAVLATGGVGSGVVAADATNVYWVDPGTPVGGGKLPLSSYTTGRVLQCPINGCGGAPTVLATYPSWLGAGALAVDAQNVYWSMESAEGTWGEIVRCSVGGCGGSPVSIGSTATRHVPTVGLAVDAARVYWTDLGSGAVFALAK